MADRDSFYWATNGSGGWPYVQDRGGPKGFVKVIDDRTLAPGTNADMMSSSNVNIQS